MQKWQRGFGAVEIVTVGAIIVVIGVGGWYLWQKTQVANTSPPIVAQSEEPNPEPPKETTKKYVNTKYGYSFEYPAEAKIYSDTTYGGQPIPITAESDVVFVDVGEKRFEVWFNGGNMLSTEHIYQNFSGTVKRDDIVITTITWKGTFGMKVTFKDPKFTASYFYLQKTIGSPVAMLSVSAGLEDIYNSFIFE